jgi:hypothetical protein
VLSSTPGNASPIFRTMSKSIVLLGIGQRDSVELTVLIWLGAGMNMPPQVDAAELADNDVTHVAWKRISRASRNPCYSQRNTFAESAVHTTNTTASAATSPTCAHHASPFQIPSSSDTV